MGDQGRAVRAGLLAGLLVLLAACAGSASEPRVLPSASAAPSVTPSAVPTGINAPTPEGAAAFARYFYAEITRAFAERDPSIVSRLSLPTCKTCKLYVDSIAGVRNRSETVAGAAFDINFAVAPAVSGASVTVDVGWDFDGAEFRDSRGKVIDVSKAEVGIEEQMVLTQVDSKWLVATVKRIRKR